MTSAKNDQYFNTAHLRADLKGRSVRGGAITVASQGIAFLLRMGSTIFLARLLTPADYGLIGMATVITGFVELFKDLGLSAATVQKSEINHQQVSTLFWINLGISCLVALLVASLSPVVAWFYKEPRLMLITLALSSNFIFGGLTVQHQALMKRQMQFTSLAKIGIVSMAMGLIVGIIAAQLGAGYWSLIALQAASSITGALMTWIMCRWRPGRPVRNSGVREMLAFGGNLTGFRTLNYFSRNLDNILIGRVWGAAELGLYAKAYQLVLLPIQQINSPVTSVAMPALSNLQGDPERYKRYYYRAILLITFIGMPIPAFLFATADKVILLLLGENWLDVVPIFRLLMPAAFIGTFNVATGWVFQSLGRTDRQFRAGIFGSFFNALIFLLGIRWGAMGVAAAYGLSRPLFIIPMIIYAYQGTPLRVGSLFKVLAYPIFSSSLAAGITWLFSSTLLDNQLILAVDLLVNGIIFLAAYIIAWLLFPGGKSHFQGVLDTLAILRKGKQTKA